MVGVEAELRKALASPVDAQIRAVGFVWPLYVSAPPVLWPQVEGEEASALLAIGLGLRADPRLPRPCMKYEIDQLGVWTVTIDCQSNAAAPSSALVTSGLWEPWKGFGGGGTLWLSATIYGCVSQ
eukprot:4282067-Prymnesium_polylepis.2